ncbi:unnamed protein product [Penicillium pancosmium]
MLLQALLLVFTGIAVATPSNTEQRGFTTGNDLRDDPCRDVTFIFARGTFQPGYLGLVGSQLCDVLKVEHPGQVSCQGVGPAYDAGLDNLKEPEDTTDVGINEAVSLFELATRKCPKSKIFAGGYSQGANLMHGAILKLSEEVKDKIRGVVLFGFTRQKQFHGQIAGFPQDKLKLYCYETDNICHGGGLIGLEHLSYAQEAQNASDWLWSRD